MKCLIFCGGNALEVVARYNSWAKGKYLSKDVIIHSHVVPPEEGNFASTIAILVFFDEKLHDDWIAKVHTAKDMVNQHIKGVESVLVMQ